MRPLLLVALLIMDSWMNPAVADIDCSTVASLASSCSDYVLYGSRKAGVDSPCCNALDSLHNIAIGPEDRRNVCKCLVGLMSMYSPNLTAVVGLPSLCEVPLGIPLDPKANCDLIP